MLQLIHPTMQENQNVDHNLFSDWKAASGKLLKLKFINVVETCTIPNSFSSNK
jgi:hypothetical protein